MDKIKITPEIFNYIKSQKERNNFSGIMDILTHKEMLLSEFIRVSNDLTSSNDFEKIIPHWGCDLLSKANIKTTTTQQLNEYVNSTEVKPYSITKVDKYLKDKQGFGKDDSQDQTVIKTMQVQIKKQKPSIFDIIFNITITIILLISSGLLINNSGLIGIIIASISIFIAIILILYLLVRYLNFGGKLGKKIFNKIEKRF